MPEGDREKEVSLVVLSPGFNDIQGRGLQKYSCSFMQEAEPVLSLYLHSQSPIKHRVPSVRLGPSLPLSLNHPVPTAPAHRAVGTELSVSLQVKDESPETNLTLTCGTAASLKAKTEAEKKIPATSPPTSAPSHKGSEKNRGHSSGTTRGGRRRHGGPGVELRAGRPPPGPARVRPKPNAGRRLPER